MKWQIKIGKVEQRVVHASNVVDIRLQRKLLLFNFCIISVDQTNNRKQNNQHNQVSCYIEYMYVHSMFTVCSQYVHIEYMYVHSN